MKKHHYKKLTVKTPEQFLFYKSLLHWTTVKGVISRYTEVLHRITLISTETLHAFPVLYIVEFQLNQQVQHT